MKRAKTGDGRRTNNGASVLCRETGKVYNSVREAAQILGINENGITQCITGRAHTAGGYHWERYESLCLSCQNATGVCSWSRLSHKNGAPSFSPVKGWEATKGIREYSTRKNSTAYHVTFCPIYIPDLERDLSKYKKIDDEIEKEFAMSR